MSKFLHDDDNDCDDNDCDAKAKALRRVYSENSRAKNVEKYEYHLN